MPYVKLSCNCEKNKFVVYIWIENSGEYASHTNGFNGKGVYLAANKHYDRCLQCIHLYHTAFLCLVWKQQEEQIKAEFPVAMHIQFWDVYRGYSKLDV